MNKAHSAAGRGRFGSPWPKLIDYHKYLTFHVKFLSALYFDRYMYIRFCSGVYCAINAAPIIHSVGIATAVNNNRSYPLVGVSLLRVRLWVSRCGSCCRWDTEEPDQHSSGNTKD